MTDGLLSLSWNNHKSTFCHILSTLREKERYTDVTLACEGKFYPTHKLVLSTCSEYFEKMFENTPCKHPVILLSKDVKCDELEALLSYMYDGVVSVAQNDLSRLIKVAELLQIKGLAVPDEPPPARKSYSWSARDDRTSPPTKRRRREDNSYTPLPGEKVTPVSQPSSPLLSSRLESEQNREQNNTEGTTEDVSQRLEYKQETDSVQSHDNTDETLVKEEIVETVHDAPSDEQSLEFSSHAGSDTTAGGDDQVVKYPQHLDPSKTAQPLHEAVVEALAGPSGMQGWLGTGDLGTGFPMLESFSEEGTQDAQPIPITGTQQPHQMVERCSGGDTKPGTYLQLERYSGGDTKPGSFLQVERYSGGDEDDGRSEEVVPRKRHHCPYCDLTTVRKDNMQRHIRTHTGEKPYSCPLCTYRSSTKHAMNKHERIHTGEKPYSCSVCPYRTSRKYTLQVHMLKHHSIQLLSSS